MAVLWALYITLGLLASVCGICFYQYKRLRLAKKMLDLIDYPLWLSNTKDQLLYCNQAYKDVFEDSTLKQGYAYVIPAKTPYRKAMVIQGERRIYDFFQKPIGAIKIAWGIDHTETETLTLELKRHAEAYREVLENLSAGISIYGADRRLKFYNHAYARMFSFNTDWLNGQPSLGEVIDDLWSRRLLTEHANHQAYRRQEVERAISALTPHEELIHLPNDRSFRRIMAPHPLGGSFYIFEDVTSTLSLERQYNTQIAVQKASLDNLFEGIAVFGSDNRLRLTNPAFDKLWESRSHSPPWGRHISELLDTIQDIFNFEGEWEVYRADLISRITDRVPKCYKFTRKDKKVISFSYVPLPDGSHLMTFVDVTDSYNIERVLREQNTILETNDRLRSEFIANVSYELRNPLQAILGFAELLDQASFGPLNERQHSFCNHILSATQVLLDLVNTILDISTLESGALVLNYQLIDINKMLASVIHITKARAKQMNVTITLKADKNLGTMEADRARLKQILFNIISNGIQGTKSGENLILVVEADETCILFKVTYSASFSAPSSNGYGLGLSLVKRLVELHAGVFQEHPPTQDRELTFKIPRFKTVKNKAA